MHAVAHRRPAQGGGSCCRSASRGIGAVTKTPRVPEDRQAFLRDLDNWSAVRVAHRGKSSAQASAVRPPRLPNRKPWLGAAAGSGPSGHGVALGPVWSSSLPPRRALLGFQRIAPSQGQVCSAVGPALCQLPARSRFSSRDPGFGKTGGRQLSGRACSTRTDRNVRHLKTLYRTRQGIPGARQQRSVQHSGKGAAPGWGIISTPLPTRAWPGRI
jgi:hypothetical protein